MAIDRPAAERAIAAFLAALGHPLGSDQELAETPQRVVEAYMNDLLSGESTDVGELLRNGRAATPPEAAPVVLRGLRMATLCPHHLLPAVGTATVAYVPGRFLVGIGTLARLLDALSRRLTLQETIGQSVVGAMMQHLEARSALCHLDLLHTCLAARGARQSEARVVTLATAGEPIEHLAVLLGGAS